MFQTCVAGASRPTSSGGGFFDNAVGAQFAKKSETPTRAPSPRPTSQRPTSSRPSSSRPTSSGGGFFDNAVGAQFAKKSEAPTREAPKQAAPARPSSGKWFYCDAKKAVPASTSFALIRSTWQRPAASLSGLQYRRQVYLKVIVICELS